MIRASTPGKRNNIRVKSGYKKGIEYEQDLNKHHRPTSRQKSAAVKRGNFDVFPKSKIMTEVSPWLKHVNYMLRQGKVQQKANMGEYLRDICKTEPRLVNAN